MSEINTLLLAQLEVEKKRVHTAIRNELKRVFPERSVVYVFLNRVQKNPTKAMVDEFYADGYIRVELENPKGKRGRFYNPYRRVHFSRVQKTGAAKEQPK